EACRSWSGLNRRLRCQRVGSLRIGDLKGDGNVRDREREILRRRTGGGGDECRRKDDGRLKVSNTHPPALFVSVQRPLDDPSGDTPDFSKDYEIVSPECGELRILRYNSGRHDSTSMIFGRQITFVEAEVKYKFRLRGGPCVTLSSVGFSKREQGFSRLPVPCVDVWLPGDQAAAAQS
ncbi:hypothetical protein Bbelb_295900, partial [Branchiostoma belcheri]